MRTPGSRGTSPGHLPQPPGPFCCQQTSSLGPDIWCGSTAPKEHSRPEKHCVLEPEEALRPLSQPLHFTDRTRSPERLQFIQSHPAEGAELAGEKGRSWPGERLCSGAREPAPKQCGSDPGAVVGAHSRRPARAWSGMWSGLWSGAWPGLPCAPLHHRRQPWEPRAPEDTAPLLVPPEDTCPPGVPLDGSCEQTRSVAKRE